MDCDKFLLFLALASFGFGYGNAIKCFRCHSTFDAGCETSQDISGRMELIVDCDMLPIPEGIDMSHPTMCSKIIKYVHDQRIVTRECFFNTPRSLESNDICMRDMKEFHVTYEMCNTCATDLCNGEAMEQLRVYSGVSSQRSMITRVLIASLSLFLSAQM